MRDALEQLASGRPFTREEARAVMGRIMDGEVGPAEMGALLMGLRLRGESVQEIAGFAEAMRARMTRVPARTRPLLDTCGTGGDGQQSLNISTVAGLIAAAAGARVAKHGNRSVSSRSGSADLLEALGVPVTLSPDEAATLLDTEGFAFLFAPSLNPSMRHAMPVRQALGIRTVFNLLGPLANPAGAEHQLLGVYTPERVETVAAVLAELGSRHALVVHGGGFDEISLAGPTLVAEVQDGRIRRYEMDLTLEGYPFVAPAALLGGDPSTNAARTWEILQGAGGPAAEVVLVNAGYALYAADIAPTPRDGVALARQAVAEGRALALVERLGGRRA